MRKKLLFYGLFYLFLCGCANIVAPDGGPKDTEPPEFLEALPANKSLNFTEKEIKMQFSEKVQLRNKTSISVSPTLKYPIAFVEKGTQLLLRLKDTLRPNTTYTINFGENITDVNENTPLKGFVFVFSTGNFLDSLKISGKVQNAFTNQAQPEITIGLYAETDTVINQKPIYFAKTDKNGGFTLENLGNQRYQIIAFADKNPDNKPQRNEAIAFLDSSILPQNQVLPSLRLYEPQNTQQRIISIRAANIGKIVANLAQKNTENTTFFLLNAEKKPEPFLLENKNDTLNVFYKNTETDSLFFIVKDTNFLDTAIVQNKKSAQYSFEKNLTILSQKTVVELPNAIKLTTNAALKSIDNQKIILYLDNKPQKIDSLKIQGSQINGYAKLLSNQKYQVVALAGAYTDFYGNTNAKPDTTTFTSPKEGDFGKLILVNCDTLLKKNYIAQLLNANGDPMQSKEILEASQSFENLVPATYRLRFFIDKNKNKRLDSGDFGTKTQPETIYFFADEVKIRANWELEVDAKKIFEP